MKAPLAVVFVVLLLAALQVSAVLSPYNLVSSPFTVPHIIQAPQHDQALAHPAVVENAVAESQLPQELLNPFYKNPAIAAGLAKESWFTNNEFPVHHREAEKIPRSEIYKIISRLQRRRR